MASKSTSRIKAAIRRCLRHAKRIHYRDVADLANLMGVDKWVLEKWLANARIPVEEIPSFELACGCNDLSKCVASIAGYTTIPASTGRLSRATSAAEVHLHVASAIAESVAAEIDHSLSGKAVIALSNAIESLAWLRRQFYEIGDADA